MKTTASFKDKSYFDNNTWSDTEIEQSTFKDERLHKRFKSLLGQMWTGIGESIPFACQDWANTKAAYRFLGNNRVSEQEILQGHFQSAKIVFQKQKGQC